MENKRQQSRFSKNNNTNHNYYLIASAFCVKGTIRVGFYFQVVFYLFQSVEQIGNQLQIFQFEIHVDSATHFQPSPLSPFPPVHVTCRLRNTNKMLTIFLLNAVFHCAAIVFSGFFFSTRSNRRCLLRRNRREQHKKATEEVKMKKKRKKKPHDKKWIENGIGRKGNDYSVSVRNGRYFQLEKTMKIINY